MSSQRGGREGRFRQGLHAVAGGQWRPALFAVAGQVGLRLLEGLMEQTVESACWGIRPVHRACVGGVGSLPQQFRRDGSTFDVGELLAHLAVVDREHIDAAYVAAVPGVHPALDHPITRAEGLLHVKPGGRVVEDGPPCPRMDSRPECRIPSGAGPVLSNTQSSLINSIAASRSRSDHAATNAFTVSMAPMVVLQRQSLPLTDSGR